MLVGLWNPDAILTLTSIPSLAPPLTEQGSDIFESVLRNSNKGITGLPSRQWGINMMSGGIGAVLAAVCMTLRCVDILCYSATPLTITGQIASWISLAGLGDGYYEIKSSYDDGALRTHTLHIGRPTEG